MRLRTLRKKAMADLLSDAGLNTFRSFQPSTILVALLIIACNRLKPDAPYLAYRYLLLQLYRHLRSCKSDKTKWTSVRGKELLDVHLQPDELNICPCCRQKWETENDLNPDRVDK